MKTIIAFIIFSTVLHSCSIGEKSDAQGVSRGVSETIMISSNINDTITGSVSLQGFLHGGVDTIDPNLIYTLRPSSWRIGSYAINGSSYESAIKYAPEITLNINDYYMIQNRIFSQKESKPWLDNWKKWDELVRILRDASEKQKKPVSFWDVWGEGDNFWTGTKEQFYEMYIRTYRILSEKIIHPNIVGPEFGFASCNFSTDPLIEFLYVMKQNSVPVSAISWHEFCKPQDVVTHVDQFKKAIYNNNLSMPRIHISEYSGPMTHNIPGWSIGWLSYLEKSKIQLASRACWDEHDQKSQWSNCEKGLNGLLLGDNMTPQANYWIYKTYADISLLERLSFTSSDPQTAIIGGKDPLTDTITLLIGRYDSTIIGSPSGTKNIEIILSNVGKNGEKVVPVKIEKIPASTVSYSVPLLQPGVVFSGAIRSQSGQLHITLPDFVDGDGYIARLYPSL